MNMDRRNTGEKLKNPAFYALANLPYQAYNPCR